MQLIPSIDLRAGRSRLVYWPGASTGQGTPTDRPERIARAFVELGAPAIHLVDLDGAVRGVPVASAAIAAVARTVAVPLQLAGGADGPEQIELAFAAGATRVVVPLWRVVEDDPLLAACLAVAGDWLAVGVDARADRLRDYPWRSGRSPALGDVLSRLADRGVRRFVLSHWATAELEEVVAMGAARDVGLQLAGGISGTERLAEVAALGIDGVLLGEALFNGTIDYTAAATMLRPAPVSGASEV